MHFQRISLTLTEQWILIWLSPKIVRPTKERPPKQGVGESCKKENEGAEAGYGVAWRIGNQKKSMVFYGWGPMCIGAARGPINMLMYGYQMYKFSS